MGFAGGFAPENPFFLAFEAIPPPAEFRGLQTSRQDFVVRTAM
jgi:hypothetical protein